MKKYRAIFFDRDGTLTRENISKSKKRDEYISNLIGTNFELDHELNMKIFWKVWEENPELKPVKNIETENKFWYKWFILLLKHLGVKNEIKNHAKKLYEKYCFYKNMELYPEVIEVLDFLKFQGYEIGVISDTFPSLKLSLKELSIANYFKSFTASSLVGAGKPDPKIFKAALKKHNLSANECLYVDDTKNEAEGARKIGFTSFYLHRDNNKSSGEWTINDLSEIVTFIKKNQL